MYIINNNLQSILCYLVDKFSLQYNIFVMATYFVTLLFILLLMLLLYDHKFSVKLIELYLRLLIAIFVSLIVFSFTKVIINQSYILIIISIIYFLYSSIRWRRNAYEFHCEYLPILLGIQYSYFINKIQVIDFEIICRYKLINVGTVSLLIVISGLFVNKIVNLFFKKVGIYKNNIKYFDIEGLELFNSRKENLSLIKEYLNNDYVNGIGIEAEFGKGKSFLIKKVINDNKDCCFIIIELLTCSIGQTEEITSFLLNKFERIFVKYGIYSSSFKTIEKLVSHFNILFNFDYCFADETITDTFEKLRHDIILSGIKFVIIVDDVDRLENYNILIKVFNILERIQSSYCKIIYLYNPEKLLNNQNVSLISYDYIEKYIPYRLSLSKVTFEDLIESIKLYKEKNIISEKVFSFCSNALIEMRDNCFNWVYNTHEARRVNSNYIVFFNKITPRNFQSLVFTFDILRKRERFNDESKWINLFKYLFVKRYMPNVVDLFNKSSHIYLDLKFMKKSSDGNVVWSEFENINLEVLSTMYLLGFNPYVFFRQGTIVYIGNQQQGLELTGLDIRKANNSNFNILNIFCNIRV